MVDEVRSFTLEVIFQSLLGDYVTGGRLDEIKQLFPFFFAGMVSFLCRLPWRLNTTRSLNFGPAMDARQELKAMFDI